MDNNIYVSELSASRHIFNKYHFCRGNSNKRKSRLGLIINGSGTYIYLDHKLKVTKGDVVFIPENIYCYSEWHGDPLIEVVYLSCFMHYESHKYGAQIIEANADIKADILQISELLTKEPIERLEAYSRFYKLLGSILPHIKPMEISMDPTVQAAVDFMIENWDKDFLVADVAKKCCTSESTVYHLFKKTLGQTPVGFVNSIRINVAIEYLENSNHSISKISEMVGFRSENHFRHTFHSLTGTTPLKFRKSKCSLP